MFRVDARPGREPRQPTAAECRAARPV